MSPYTYLGSCKVQCPEIIMLSFVLTCDYVIKVKCLDIIVHFLVLTWAAVPRYNCMFPFIYFESCCEVQCPEIIVLSFVFTGDYVIR